MLTETAAAARDWLAAADPQPAHAHRWWDAAEVVLLPLGSKWDAVQVGEHLARQALAAVSGPVIHDPAAGNYIFLVPAGTSAAWDVVGAECLGVACWLTVPAPTRTAPPGLHWLRAPDGTGTLADPVALRAALGEAA